MQRYVEVTKRVPMVYCPSRDEFVPAETFDVFKCEGFTLTYGERILVRLNRVFRRWEFGRKMNVTLWPRTFRRYALGCVNVLVLDSVDAVE